MPDGINFNPNIRALPIYQDGLSLGLSIGLRIAMDALTAERGLQERLGEQPDHPGSPACREYAEGVLLTITKQLAGRFRHA
jgi:hypothetical protein